ncbi:MAG TPA: hypothetical protein IAB12_04195 [Candidatus Ornithospirochaeta avicola]|uniref:2-oxoacid dehydrogenase acyltransferase catalytic domain-containing protein n=1 Tax=Candidatus Ornithospirochaeta avicola TaxID=2840896 RepID=A0A9D1PUF9_9SPIO|nr:hypothetical protein [Candidatus Ornithospirochaeta avicola]
MKEGRKLKLDAFSSITPYIMVTRAESCNSISLEFPCRPAEEFVRQLRSEGYDSIGMMHVLLASYVRTISQRPRCNRFIRGQKIYARNGIIVNMVVKRKMNIETEDTIIKMRFNPEDTIFDVYETVNKALAEVMENNNTDFDKTAVLLNYIPGLVKKFAFWLLKTMDYFGLIPKKLINVSPFHGSLFVTNLASLNVPSIIHHLYNFGNIPMFIAFGAKKGILVLEEDGTVEKERVMDVVINMDERITDGFYFASALKILKKVFTHPEELRLPPEKVVVDNGNKS